MHYKKFRIRNFKGIKDTTVEFHSGEHARVYSLVGLNESGKTTVLEAIHSFSPDYATSRLVGGSSAVEARVPRHLLSSFNGEVSVEATLVLEDGEPKEIADELKSRGYAIDTAQLPRELNLERVVIYKSGDKVGEENRVNFPINIKKGRSKKWRAPDREENEEIFDAIWGFSPDIAYFPTFVFEFPERIFLTPKRGGPLNSFYRQVFQDVLDYDGRGLKIEEHVMRRIRTAELTKPWLNFLALWKTKDDDEKIQHVMDRVGAVVTEVVFGRWNKIFHEEARGKEVTVSFDLEEGQITEKGVVTKTEEHDLYVKFHVKDGTRRFNVNDRSLGFRWFFAFMLFTQFRVARGTSRPVLFLFDEPASNLHAAAQQKLIESFPEIARGQHTLLYTTHSHYMIEPKWLEQTFIVTNRSDAPGASVLDAVSLDDESLDIQVSPYRRFVNEHPNQTSYFQPVIDRLEVVPSKFDLTKSSIVVEGRSDYYVLRYAIRLLNRKEIPLVPGLGAGTFGALVALHIGWGTRVLFLLDGDQKGKAERERYVSEFGLPLDRAALISELLPEAKEIEDLLDDEALDVIKTDLGLDTRPTKNQIRRFFQERLAGDNVVALGPRFKKQAGKLLEGLSSRLNAQV